MENKEKLNEPNWQKWFTILTPCTLIGAFAFIGVIGSLLKLEESKGWSFYGIIIFLPILVAAIIVHFVIAYLSKWKAKTIWIAEGIVSLLGLLIYWLIINDQM